MIGSNAPLICIHIFNVLVDSCLFTSEETSAVCVLYMIYKIIINSDWALVEIRLVVKPLLSLTRLTTNKYYICVSVVLCDQCIAVCVMFNFFNNLFLTHITYIHYFSSLHLHINLNGLTNNNRGLADD